MHVSHTSAARTSPARKPTIEAAAQALRGKIGSPEGTLRDGLADLVLLVKLAADDLPIDVATRHREEAARIAGDCVLAFEDIGVEIAQAEDNSGSAEAIAGIAEEMRAMLSEMRESTERFLGATLSMIGDSDQGWVPGDDDMRALRKYAGAIRTSIIGLECSIDRFDVSKTEDTEEPKSERKAKSATLEEAKAILDLGTKKPSLDDPKKNPVGVIGQCIDTLAVLTVAMMRFNDGEEAQAMYSAIFDVRRRLQVAHEVLHERELTKPPAPRTVPADHRLPSILDDMQSKVRDLYSDAVDMMAQVDRLDLATTERIENVWESMMDLLRNVRSLECDASEAVSYVPKEEA